eukprot:jgi/Botrbrau1/12517/Bobra.0169s0059.1
MAGGRLCCLKEPVFSCKPKGRIHCTTNLAPLGFQMALMQVPSNTCVKTTITLYFICVHGEIPCSSLWFSYIYLDERVRSIIGRSASHLRRKLHAL